MIPDPEKPVEPDEPVLPEERTFPEDATATPEDHHVDDPDPEAVVDEADRPPASGADDADEGYPHAQDVEEDRA